MVLGHVAGPDSMRALILLALVASPASAGGYLWPMTPDDARWSVPQAPYPTKGRKDVREMLGEPRKVTIEVIRPPSRRKADPLPEAPPERDEPMDKD